MKKKKNFIVNTLLSSSVFAWLLQTILGGILGAIASFFTKKVITKWNQKSSSINKVNDVE